MLIGATAGLVSFVPYLGAGSGFVVAICVAAAQFWPNWTPVAAVGGVFVFGEILADYGLSPRIIGNRVKLNPVWLMFSLFAFGYLFGFIGLLIAIPLAASLGAVLRYAMREIVGTGELGPAGLPESVESLAAGPSGVADHRPVEHPGAASSRLLTGTWAMLWLTLSLGHR